MLVAVAALVPLQQVTAALVVLVVAALVVDLPVLLVPVLLRQQILAAVAVAAGELQAQHQLLAQAVQASSS